MRISMSIHLNIQYSVISCNLWSQFSNTKYLVSIWHLLWLNYVYKLNYVPYNIIHNLYFLQYEINNVLICYLMHVGEYYQFSLHSACCILFINNDVELSRVWQIWNPTNLHNCYNWRVHGYNISICQSSF